MSPRSTAVPLALVALVAAGCGGSGGESSSSQQAASAPSPTQPAQAAPAVQSATVDIKSFKYKPVAVTVKKGGRVRWMNADAAAHTATADDRSFDTQTINQGKTRVVSMTRVGTFRYHCDFHPFMKAMVVVK